MAQSHDVRRPALERDHLQKMGDEEKRPYHKPAVKSQGTARLRRD